MESLAVVSPISALFTSLTLSCFFLGIPLIRGSRWLPQSLRILFLFGKLYDAKAEAAETSILRAFRLPKRYFTHFYIFASFYNLLVLALICLTYSGFGHIYLQLVSSLLDLIDGRNRQVENVEPVAITVTAILMWCHVLRRCYECLRVSVFSDTKIHAFHYVVAVAFYWGAITSLIVRAPGFNSTRFLTNNHDPFQWRWNHVCGITLYFWASWHQHRCLKILANLRIKTAGKSVTHDHKLPTGDWFNYVYCPHFFAEILIYVALNLVLGFQNSLWIFVLAFVIVNQTITALQTKKWYQERFNYTKNQKALIPFLL